MSNQGYDPAERNSGFPPRPVIELFELWILNEITVD